MDDYWRWLGAAGIAAGLAAEITHSPPKRPQIVFVGSSSEHAPEEGPNPGNSYFLRLPTLVNTATNSVSHLRF